MEGFFSPAQTEAKQPVSTLPKCGACGIHKDCQSPKMAVHGKGRMKILVVGEAPGAHEDDQNRPFVGEAGQKLRSALSEFGIDLDKDCWATNALSCRPPKNRTPTPKEIDHCRPLVFNAIQDLNPVMIIPLGGVAVKSLFGSFLQGDVGGIGRWAGWRIPFQKWNAWVCPNYHPSYVQRSAEQRDGPVVELLFRSFLERAFEHAGGRPFDTVPDYEQDIGLVYNPNEAADWIDNCIKRGGAVAIDYETNRLKPDNQNARIATCALCWQGKQTIAYPFVGAAIAATKRLIACPSIGKIGANNKFEDRWSRAILGQPVVNWVWDTMLSSHHLDNRPRICGVDFQAFVRLGQLPWDEHISPYLKSSDSEGSNRIHVLEKTNMRSLLIYNGLDSLLEFLIAQLQKKEMFDGVE